ncbi:MAG: hypothetical protein ACKO0V_10795, partial [bacterium]
MNHDREIHHSGIDRRTWLGASATGVITSGLHQNASAAQNEAPSRLADPLPTRPLGRSGIPVSMLNLGTFRN